MTSERQIRDAAIAAAFNAGESRQSLAERHGLTVSHIYKIIRQQNIAPPPEIMLDPFYSERAIAVAAEIAGANVQQLVSYWRAPKILVHARWAVMTGMRRRGATLCQIGRRLGRDHQTVLYGLRQARIFSSRSPDFAEMLARVDAA